MGKVLELKHTHGAVPQNRFRLQNDFLPVFERLRTGIHAFPTVGNVENIHYLTFGIVREIVGSHRLHRQTQVHTLLLRSSHHAQRLGHQLVFVERQADVSALRLDEREAHAAADNQVIDLVEQVFDDGEFRAHLRAADDGRERMLCVFEHVVNGLNFLLHEQAEHFLVGIEIVGDDSRGSVFAMSRSEGVVHIDVGIRGQRFRELFLRGFHGFLGFIVFGSTFLHAHGLSLFLGIEAQVFEQQHLAHFQGCGLLLSLGAVGCEGHGHAKRLLHIFANLSEREFRVYFSFRLSHVAHQNECAAVAEDFLQRGQGTADAGVVGDFTIFVEWHVEIYAHDCLFSGKIKVVDCHHFFLIFKYYESVILFRLQSYE